MFKNENKVIMQGLLNQARSQIIDASGKCRTLYFSLSGGKGLLLHIRPIPPSNLAEVKKSKIAPPPSLDEAQKFCDLMGLKITANVVMRDQTVGIRIGSPDAWVLDNAYIPIEATTKVISGLRFEKSSSDPLLTPSVSWPLTDMRLKRRTVSVIQAYVLWTYSRHLQGVVPWKKRDSFWVVDYPESIYMIKVQDNGSRLFAEGNTAIYTDDFRIKVTSDELITRLLKWLRVQTIREPDLVNRYWERTTIPNLLKTVSDFKQEEKQLVFVNKNGLLSWIKNKEEAKTRGGKFTEGDASKLTVYNEIIPGTSEPYFYSLGKKLVLIQNVKRGRKETAELVAWYWHVRKINQGYSPVAEDIKVPLGVKLIDYTNPPDDLQGPVISEAMYQGKKVYFAILPV